MTTLGDDPTTLAMRGLSGLGPVVLKARNQLRMAFYPTYGPQAYLLELELV